MIKILVTKKYDDKKLIRFLLLNYPNLTLNRIYSLLRKKDILINGKRVSKDTAVFDGDEIVVYINLDEISADNKSLPSLQINYEDDFIVVVDKPTGILSLGDENAVFETLSKTYPDLHACHRLDRNTAGLLVFAKDKQTKLALIEMFKKRKIKKYYLCTVVGMFAQKESTLKAYLFKDSKKATVYISDNKKAGYIEIITKYKVLKEDAKNNLSTLEIELITGRTHQIRAHLAHIGHPVLGDRKIRNKQN